MRGAGRRSLCVGTRAPVWRSRGRLPGQRSRRQPLRPWAQDQRLLPCITSVGDKRGRDVAHATRAPVREVQRAARQTVEATTRGPCAPHGRAGFSRAWPGTTRGMGPAASSGWGSPAPVPPPRTPLHEVPDYKMASGQPTPNPWPTGGRNPAPDPTSGWPSRAEPFGLFRPARTKNGPHGPKNRILKSRANFQPNLWGRRLEIW